MTPTEVPTEKGTLILVYVPGDAKGIQVCVAGSGHDVYRLVYFGSGGRDWSTNILLGNKQHVLIGTVTNGNPPTFTFDPEPWVERYLQGENIVHAWYKDYKPHEDDVEFPFEQPEQSFLSLIESKGVLIRNPYGEEAPKSQVLVMGVMEATGIKKNPKYAEWQEAQSRVFEQVVVLLKK